jgi:hypothetical protein
MNVVTCLLEAIPRLRVIVAILPQAASLEGPSGASTSPEPCTIPCTIDIG